MPQVIGEMKGEKTTGVMSRRQGRMQANFESLRE